MHPELSEALRNRYRIERELGVGGMATVYLAHDLKHDREVAIKVVAPELGARVGAERFLSEIRVTATLQHPHILPLFDSGDANGLLYYVMPYVAGETLRDRLDRDGVLPLEDALSITSALAAALEYAHRKGVVHRDVKPENILIAEGVPQLADFGVALATRAADEERFTKTGHFVGTPNYASPEQATGARTLGPHADQYALAAVLYEMLSGEPPFTGPSTEAVIARLLIEPPRPIRTVRPNVSEQLEAAILKALSKHPGERYKSMHQFAAALTKSRSTIVRVTRVWKSRAMQSVGGVLAVAGLLFVGFYASDPAPALSNRSNLTFHGNVLWSSLSPDGKYLAYLVLDANDTHTVLVRDLEGVSEDTLIRLPSIANIEWSPNSTHILVSGMDRDSGTIASIPRSGGPYVPLAFARQFKWVRAKWMPSGDEISLIPNDTAPRLLNVRLDAMDSTTVAIPGDHLLLETFEWSPDGRRVAVVLAGRSRSARRSML